MQKVSLSWKESGAEAKIRPCCGLNVEQKWLGGPNGLSLSPVSYVTLILFGTHSEEDRNASGK